MLPDRFWLKVVDDPVRGCRLWTGAIGDDGYGRVSLDGRIVSTHKAVWEDVHGPVPDGRVLLHSCDETICVEVTHLDANTQTENQQQMSRRGRAGGPWHRGLADTRGAAGRARALREALAGGFDLERLEAAKRAGDPRRHQLVLPLFEAASRQEVAGEQQESAR